MIIRVGDFFKLKHVICPFFLVVPMEVGEDLSCPCPVVMGLPMGTQTIPPQQSARGVWSRFVEKSVLEDCRNAVVFF